MNVCVFGDSITWGASDQQKGGWVERLKTHYMEKKEDVDIYNLGISGNNTDDLLRRFESEVISRKPSIAVFAIGINDSKYKQENGNRLIDLEKFKSNISKLIEAAQKAVNGIIFVGLTRVDELKTMPISWNTSICYDNESVEKYDMSIENLCKEKGLKHISMKGVVEVTDLEDGLHPNHEGHEKMFKTVLEAIDELIEQKLI